MQDYNQMPPAGLQQQTTEQVSYNRIHNSTELLHYFPHQPYHGLQNSQSSTLPVRNSSNLQSREMPQTWYTGQVLLRNSAPITATLPNGQFAPSAAAQHGDTMQNLTQHPWTLNSNTIPQQNYNMTPLDSRSNATVSLMSSANSNGGPAVDQNYLMHQSAVPQYQSLNGHHNRMQITHQPAAQVQQTDLSVQANQADRNVYSNQGWIIGEKRTGALCNSSYHFPGTSQRLITPSQPSNYSHQSGQNHTSYNGNQSQYSAQLQQQPSPYRTDQNAVCYRLLKHDRNKHQSSPLHQSQPYTTPNFVILNQPTTNQSSQLCLPQKNVQPQTPLQQSHHNNTYHPALPAIQGNTLLQALLLYNSSSGLPRSSKFTIPSSTPTNEAPPPICTDSIPNFSRATLKDMLVENNTQVPDQRHDTSPLSCPKVSFTAERQTPSHITTKANISQIPQSASYSGSAANLQTKKPYEVNEYQTDFQKKPVLKETEPVLGSHLKEPDVQRFKGMQSRSLQTDSSKQTSEKMNEHQSNNRHGLGITEPLVFQQYHKAVAVVPPISQQVPSPEKKEHGTTSSDDSLPKINYVWSLAKESKGMNQESHVLSQPKEMTDHFSEQLHEKQQSIKNVDASTVDSIIPDTQHPDIPQSTTDSTTSQSPVCTADLSIRSSENHNNVKPTTSNDDIFDLSKVQTHKLSLKKCIDLVQFFESLPKESVTEPVADVSKCIVDLYWDGNINNMANQLRKLCAELCGVYSGVSKENIQTVMFYYFTPKDKEMLENGCYILKNDAVFPSEEFKSSWLNINGWPADIENVLAEPILDLNLTDYALQGGFDSFNINPESDPAKVIHATTDCQSEKMLNKEPVNSNVCESESTDEVSNTQEASRREDDENLQKDWQQDANMNPEKSVDSNEMTDILMESKSKTQCEQVCIDASEDIASSSEITEQKELSNDLDSNEDSQFFKFSVLSADEARRFFEEYSGYGLQNEPSQLCQDGTKVSDVKSNDFCHSSKVIKFTCPHVTDIGRGGEHFCSRCWENTPLLDIDLDDTLLSPNWGSTDVSSPKQEHQNQSCCQQSGIPDSLSSSIADSQCPNVGVSKVTMSEPSPNPSDTVDSSTSLSGESPVKEPHVPMCTESGNFAMPVKEQVNKTLISMGTESPKVLSCAQNLVISEQAKTQRDEDSPPCKKFKLIKATDVPADDDLFTTDFVAKKASSPKPHPCDLNLTLAEDGQDCIKLKVESNSQSAQSDTADQNVNICSSKPSTYGVKMSITKPHPNLDDSIQSCSSQSDKPQEKETHRQAWSDGVNVTIPSEGQVCEADILSGRESPKAQSLTQKTEKGKIVIQSQTNTSREKVSPKRYPPCKKRIAKSPSIPAADDLFTPDIVITKAGSVKPQPSDLIVTPTEDDQHFKDEYRERGRDRVSPVGLKTHHGQHSGQAKANAQEKSVRFQVPNVTPQPTRPAATANPEMNKEKRLSKRKRSGQINGMKQLELTLYGFNNVTKDRTVQPLVYKRTNSSAAPVHLMIPNRPEAATRYTDMPTAKQKVYEQWNSTFVTLEKKTFSHKRHQKHIKAELKSQVPALKSHCDYRKYLKENQMSQSP